MQVSFVIAGIGNCSSQGINEFASEKQGTADIYTHKDIIFVIGNNTRQF